jgi:hypothetical protein
MLWTVFVILLVLWLLGLTTATGAAIGAGAGTGSVLAQGREDLDLASGTEFGPRASAPPR